MRLSSRRTPCFCFRRFCYDFLIVGLMLFLLGCCNQQQDLSKVIVEASKVEDLDQDLYNLLVGWLKEQHEAEEIKIDTEIMYKIATSDNNFMKQHPKESLEIIHHLADSNKHIKSIIKLGHYYYTTEINLEKALAYFLNVAEYDHASLFNVGRIYADLRQWVPAIAYIRAAATITKDDYPQMKLKPHIQTTATNAFHILSSQLANMELSIEESADIFLYAGSLNNDNEDDTEDSLGDDAETLWTNAVLAIQSFNNTYVTTDGQKQDTTQMITIVDNLHKLWESTSSRLSPLQKHLSLEHINDFLGPLAGIDDKYLKLAAQYAEYLATMSPYCYENVAITEDDSSCFNGALSSAISYYRRYYSSSDSSSTSNNDDTEASSPRDTMKHLLEIGQQHPLASTKWELIDQTPRVYHPNLRAQPWWNVDDFTTPVALANAYEKYRKTMIKELDKVKSLQEGLLRGKTTTEEEELAEVEINVDGSSDTAPKTGMQRIFTPYIGVRTKKDETKEKGAGGWAEYGPLFDGRKWNNEKCSIVPTICQSIKENSESLCTSSAKAKYIMSRETDSSREEATLPFNSTQVTKLCGADTVVTILRLRPGTTILPHCGTTNARLIMHFCLEGCNGIEFTVGGQTVYNYNSSDDGHAIVFDDSFEHTVTHNGKKDRFVVLAVLSHPDIK